MPHHIPVPFSVRADITFSLSHHTPSVGMRGVRPVSGPIAMVVAGLLIGNCGRSHAMSPTTVERLDVIWELIDEILNAVLFVLLGLEMLVLPVKGSFLIAGLLAIGVVLFARGTHGRPPRPPSTSFVVGWSLRPRR